MKKTYRLGELFCGPGGLACGALSATSSDGTLSVAHAWANDFDHDSCMTYRNNLCPSSPGSVVEGDVRDLDIPGLRSRFGNIDHATVSPAWVSTTESPIKNSDSYTGTGSKSCENTRRTGFWQKTSPESALPEPGTFGRFFRISGNPDTILSFISTKRKTTESRRPVTGSSSSVSGTIWM